MTIRLRRGCAVLAAGLAAASAGCRDVSIIRQYQATLGVPRETAASGAEAGLEPPTTLPRAAGFIRGRVVAVLADRGDILSVRRNSDGALLQVRLAGAELAPVGQAPDPALAEVVRRSAAYSAMWVGREVVVEVPPRPPAPTGDNQVWGHVVAGGRCLDAALIFEGLAWPRGGQYPRFPQMAGAAQQAAAMGRGFPVPGRPPGSIPVPTPEPVPLPEPVE